jgi:hypothetical protein
MIQKALLTSSHIDHNGIWFVKAVAESTIYYMVSEIDE